MLIVKRKQAAHALGHVGDFNMPVLAPVFFRQAILTRKEGHTSF